MEREQLNRIRPGGAEEWKQRRTQGGAGEQKASDPQAPAGERKQPHLQDPTGERKQPRPQAPAGTHIQILPQPSAADRKPSQPRLTDEERKAAQDPDEKLKRSYLVKLLAMLVLAGAIVLYTTIAWFTMNKETGTSGMGVKVAGMPFEISVDAPYTTTPDYSSIIDSVFGYSTTVHETGGSTDAIKWVMRDDTYDSANPMRGLRPGSKGSFSFNIVPKSVGTYTISFKPMLTGYYAEFNVDAETQAINPQSIKIEEGNYILQSLSDRAAAKNEEYATETAAGNSSAANLAQKERDACVKAETFLNGHILFFEACDEGYYSILRPINQSYSKTYTFTQTQVENHTPIPVTIYWIWPNTFGQFLLDDGNSRLHDDAMFDSSQDAINGVTPRQELINYICAHPGYYFESNNASIINSGSLPTFIQGARSSSPDNLIALSNGYNNADQIIGENIQILLAEMTVSLTEE